MNDFDAIAREVMKAPPPGDPAEVPYATPRASAEGMRLRSPELTDAVADIFTRALDHAVPWAELSEAIQGLEIEKAAAYEVSRRARAFRRTTLAKGVALPEGSVRRHGSRWVQKKAGKWVPYTGTIKELAQLRREQGDAKGAAAMEAAYDRDRAGAHLSRTPRRGKLPETSPDDDDDKLTAVTLHGVANSKNGRRGGSAEEKESTSSSTKKETPQAGGKGSEGAEDKKPAKGADDDRGPVKERFKALSERARALGAKISGQLKDHHGHDVMDALEAFLDEKEAAAKKTKGKGAKGEPAGGTEGSSLAPASEGGAGGAEADGGAKPGNTPSSPAPASPEASPDPSASSPGPSAASEGDAGPGSASPSPSPSDPQTPDPTTGLPEAPPSTRIPEGEVPGSPQEVARLRAEVDALSRRLKEVEEELPKSLQKELDELKKQLTQVRQKPQRHTADWIWGLVTSLLKFGLGLALGGTLFKSEGGDPLPALMFTPAGEAFVKLPAPRRTP